MKECSGKKVLIVKVAQNDPLNLSSQKMWIDVGKDEMSVCLNVNDYKM